MSSAAGVEIPLVETPEQAKDPESGDESDDLKKSTEQDLDTGETKFPLRETSFKLPFFKDVISFNPAVSLIGLVPLWGLTGYCMSDPDSASAFLSDWFSAVIDMFTWFYIGKFRTIKESMRMVEVMFFVLSRPTYSANLGLH